MTNCYILDMINLNVFLLPRKVNQKISLKNKNKCAYRHWKIFIDGSGVGFLCKHGWKIISVLYCNSDVCTCGK